jgi:hypothetical protein
LIARLASTAFANGVDLWLQASAESLIVEQGTVKGVRIARATRPVWWRAAASCWPWVVLPLATSRRAAAGHRLGALDHVTAGQRR